MRRLVVAGFLLVLAGFALYGQTAVQKSFVVQYIDGSVQLQLKGQTAWKTLKIKAEVPTDATIKLAKGAMIELVRDKAILSLIKEGIYPLSGLLSKLQSTASGLGSTVAQKIKTVMYERPQNTAVGGVNAAQGGVIAGVRLTNMDWSNGGYTLEQKVKDEQDKTARLANKEIPKDGFEIDNLQFFYWGVKGGYADRENPRMYEEYKDAVDQGIRALLEARNGKAIEQLRNAVTEAIFPEEVMRANYLLAVAYVEDAQPVRAWQIISKLQVEKDDLEYGDVAIRKAQLQVDALLYEEALVTLKPLLEPLAKDEFGQAACLVAYYAYKGLNRNKEASEVRNKGLSIEIIFDVDGSKWSKETATARILKSLE